MKLLPEKGWESSFRTLQIAGMNEPVAFSFFESSTKEKCVALKWKDPLLSEVSC